MIKYTGYRIYDYHGLDILIGYNVGDYGKKQLVECVRYVSISWHETNKQDILDWMGVSLDEYKKYEHKLTNKRQLGVIYKHTDTDHELNCAKLGYYIVKWGDRGYDYWTPEKFKYTFMSKEMYES